jgi:hypothetical protein
MVTKFLTATFTADLWTVRALRLRRGTHERGDHLKNAFWRPSLRLQQIRQAVSLVFAYLH